MDLDRDFSEFIACCVARDVRLVVQLGYPPKRIDLLTGIDGVVFDECWQGRIEVTISGGITVPFIGRAELIANKRSSGRPQDVADAATLSEE